MKVQFTRTMAAALALGLVPVCANAKTGAPHTLNASVNFDQVGLSWQAPNMAKELKWHDGKDYNGDTVDPSNPQKTVKTWAASRFTAEDLKNYVGEKVEAITLFQYRQVVSQTVMVYEDGVVVASALADPAKYIKNTTQRVALPEAVEIKAGKEYMFVVCFEHGANVDFIAIKDRSSDAPGKGDLLSTDGVNWVATRSGEYLITANLSNDADEEPSGYNVYDGANLLTPAPIAETSLELENQGDKAHSYVVEAVYASGNVKSKAVEVSTRAYGSYAPAPTFGSAKVLDLGVSLGWAAPLMGGNSLTWAGENPVMNQSIGGTASSNTKVWVRNSFDGSDLNAFVGGKISAINFWFNEAVVSSATIWVMENGKLVYSEPLSAAAVSAIKAGEWTKMPLATPYEIKAGADVAYGVYVMHTPKMHPMGVAKCDAVDVKGNSFSTSSPNSTNFLKSNPSWKTLASGGIPGNWMMTADIVGGTAISDPVTYELTRNGQSLASGLNALAYEDNVPAPGTYTYGLTVVAGNRRSAEVTKDVVVALPPAYTAPLISDADFDPATGVVELKWNTDKELSHYGQATYMAGFDEEMVMMWGSQFSADELAAYEGMQLDRLKIALGAPVADLKVGVYTKKGVALSEIDLAAADIEDATFYEVKLPQPVAITGTEDLVLAYSGTLAAGTSPILLDGGPMVDGGARISLTNGLNWMNLGTINPSFNNYNIVISAMAVDAPEASGQALTESEDAVNIVASRNEAVIERSYGIAATEAPVANKTAAAQRPKVASFKVYCNSEELVATSETSYEGRVPGYGVFQYYVTAVYNNGWESPASQAVKVTNRIAQKAQAPFGLKGQLNANSGVDLSWESPAAATVLSYTKNVSGKGLGTTGTNPQTYCLAKFPAEQLADQVGKRIDHIVFGLIDNDLTTLDVVIAIDENIIYSQSVPVSSLVVGDNDVRLNEPFEIKAGQSVAVGYYTTYPKGVKPLATDDGPAEVGFGDIISQSGTQGYFYSLKTKFAMDQNWRIKAILSAADATLETQAADALTYNLYRDGQLIAEGLTTPAYSVEAPAHGTYYVTAVNGGEESGESNSVTIKPAGIDNIEVDDASDASARYYNLQGVEINRANAAPGLYLRRSAAGTAKVIVK